MQVQPDDLACGTIHRNRHGEEFVITAYQSARHVEVAFRKYPYQTVTTSEAIRKGWVKNRMSPAVYGVGFIGEGEWKSKDGNRYTPEYVKWKEMLRRCYSTNDREKKFPSYAGCEVCHEWHNFQNFAEWYHKNVPNTTDTWQLDKGIKGNSKLYSPETCTFVTSKGDMYYRSHVK